MDTPEFSYRGCFGRWTRRRATRHREAGHTNRRPAAHRRNPAQRPDRSPTRDNEPPRRPRATRADASCPEDPPNGGTPSRTPPTRRAEVTPEERPTPARRPRDDRPAELPRDVGRQENSASHAIAEPGQRPGSGRRRERRRRTCVNDPTSTTHGPNGIQRPHFNDTNEHHDSGAVRTRRAAAGADIQRDIRPLRRRRDSWTAATHDRTMRSSRTAGAEHDRNSTARRETPQTDILEQDEIQP